MISNESGGNTRLMRESREHCVSHNAMRAGTWRALQVRPKETVLLGLIARRSAAICVVNSSSLKTRAAMAAVTGDGKGNRSDTSGVVEVKTNESDVCLVPRPMPNNSLPDSAIVGESAKWQAGKDG